MATDAGPMEKFCGSEFWNLNVTWNTEDPDFTPCFEQTVLVWFPCGFLWIFMFLELYYLRASLDKNIPWNFKNISKIVLLVALHALCVVDVVKAVMLQDSESNLIFPVDIWTPVIKFITFAIAVMFVFLNRKYGVQTSGTFFMFWFFLILCAIPQFRTELRNYSDRHDHSSLYTEAQMSWADYKFISFMIFFGLSLLLFLLYCFADNLPRETKYNRTPKEIPEVSASFLSRLTFSWFDKMAWLGYRRPLEQTDLWELRPQDGSKEVMPLFAKHWNNNVRKNFAVANRSLKEKPAEGKIVLENPSGGAKTEKLASVMGPIVKSFGGIFLFGSLLKLVCDLLSFASPQILNLIINYTETKADDTKESEPVWKGIFYAILLFINAAVQTFFQAQYFQKMYTVGLRTRTALVNAIYRKALVISNATKKESTVGEIVNLMSVDAQRFLELVTYVSMIWSAPLQIVLALYFLWQKLGVAVLAGLVVMIILIPLNLVIASKSKKLQVKQMKYKDERVKIMNEILAGIKVLKLYAWEPSFEQQVLNIRNKEIEKLKTAAYLSAGTSFIWTCAPFLVSLVTFATYVLIDEKNVLDASTAFVSLSLFNLLRFPLAMLPMLISNLIQTQVSIKRINKFLNSEELDPDCVQHDPTAPHPMIIENGSFSWGDDVILRDINIEIKDRSLVAIVGTVGSGKSSLINAFLGEMEKLQGRVNTLGSIAYVPQQAWMQNATLRDNILFGKPYDRKRYQRVIDACALRSDFQMLAAGDQTEIGEKGINLSGGQKQRVSLARAVYSDSDVYLLDDPLSAVDSHVGKHIFEQVIGPTGLLANKTRVLVTHGITYLPKVDNIYVIKNGEVSEDGTYSELLNQKGAFSDFLIQHLTENSDEIEELDEIAEQLENTIQSEELRSKFVRAISRARSDSIDETTSVKSFGSGDGSIRKSIRSMKNGSLRKRKFSRQQSTDSVVSKLSEQAAGKKGGKLIEVETSQTGGVNWAVYKHYIKNIGYLMALTTILSNLIYQGFSIGSNLWLTKWSTDEDSATDTSLRNMYLGVYGGLGFGQVLADFTSSLTLALGCIYCSKELHEFLTKNTMHFPMEYFDTTPLGRILNRFSKDVDTVDTLLPMNLRFLITQFFSVIATVTVICISTPIFLAAIIPMGLIYWFAQRFYVATSRQLMRLESITRSPIYSHFSETVTGVTTIRAYGVGNAFIQESDDRVDLNQLCKYPSIIANRWLSIRLETIGNLVILLASLLAVLGDQTNAALVGLSVTYSLQITSTLNMLVRVLSDVETNIVSVERIKEYGDIKQEAPWQIPGEKTPNGWPQVGRVMFDNYMVRYREGLDLVLKGVTFDITGGEKVGIVGRTGAGKSSLTLSLFRIIEAAGGRITIDGVDIAKLGLHTLRSRLTIIPQDPVLFSGTLRMNLDPYNKNSDAEIWTALQLSHLKEFVKGTASGLNHEINEGGENLSVGQRQLVCLARALLRKTKVLVLDEATAAVDLETDDLIQKTIRSEFKDCTVLTIAHRLNTILDSDKVIVLDQGQIIEFDSPTNLLENKNSSFYSMAKDANLV